MDSTFSIYYPISFLSLIFLSYGLGLLYNKLSRNVPESSFSGLFKTVFIGHVLLATILALLWTQGRTISILNLPILLGLLLIYRRQLKSKGESSYLASPKILSISAGLALFSFGIFFYKYINLSDLSFLLPHPDYIYYGKVADFIYEVKFETTLMHFLNPLLGNEPYHYAELWLAGFFSQIFSNSELVNLHLVVYPFYFLLIGLGIIAIGEKIAQRKLKLLEIRICFSLIVLSGVYISHLSDVLPLYDTANLFSGQVLTRHKLMVIEVILIYAFILFLEDKEFLALLALLFIPNFFVSALPSIIGFGILVFTYKLWMSRIMIGESKKSIFGLLIFFIYGVCFFGFYKLFGESPETNFQIGAEKIMDLRVRVNIIVGALLQYTYVLLLFIPLLFFINKTDLKKLFGPLILFIMALFSWAVIYFINNSVQFFYNISTPLISLLLAYIFMLILFNRERMNPILSKLSISYISIILIFFWIQGISYRGKEVCDNEYVTATISAAKDLNPIGTFIMDSSDYSTFFSRLPHYYVPAKHLSLIDPKFHMVSLSVHSSPIESPPEEKAIKNSVFYRFANENIEESQLRFIRDHNIQYLVLTKNAELPFNLQPLVKKEFVSKCNGERFYLLNQGSTP